MNFVALDTHAEIGSHSPLPIGCYEGEAGSGERVGDRSEGGGNANSFKISLEGLSVHISPNESDARP